MLYSISEVRKFATGLDHPEGVAVGRDGTVYAGGEAGQVYRISRDGEHVEVMANTGGFCLGISLDLRKTYTFVTVASVPCSRLRKSGK